MMKNLKLLLNYMKGNRILYIGAIISTAFSTLFSLINPLIIRVSIDSIIGDEPLDIPQWTLTIISYLGGKDVLIHRLWLIGLIMVSITIIMGVFLYAKGKWSAQAAERIAKNIRERLLNHIQHLPHAYHVKAETGDLIQRCTSDLDTIRRFLAVQLVEVGRAIFLISLSAYIMFSLNVKLTLISMAIMPVIFIFAVVFFMKIKKAFKKSDEAEASMSSRLQENLTGIRVVKAFGNQAYEVEKFDQKNKSFRDLTYRLIRLLAGYWASSDLLCMGQMGIILLIGIYWTVNGTITLGTLVVFTTYEGMLLWPVRQMGRILSDMGKAFVAMERIHEILDQPVETEDDGKLCPEIKGDIEFENVCFAYEGDNPIVKNLSFKVKQGETVAILGPTGSGKSTLMYLLTRLYECNQGTITIDGFNIKDINKKWLREKIGFVLQEPFLFAKSIEENIALARRDVREKEIEEAAQIAAIHDVILEFDEGYKTLVGERGVSLSGGQKQRIAIARTLIKNCPVLIFDDSLSAVDTETDLAIRKALSKKNKNVTSFIISHRINTLKEADRIFVMEDGMLVHEGTHEELINKPGFYRRTWTIQNGLEEEVKLI